MKRKGKKPIQKAPGKKASKTPQYFRDCRTKKEAANWGKTQGKRKSAEEILDLLDRVLELEDEVAIATNQRDEEIAFHIELRKKSFRNYVLQNKLDALRIKYKELARKHKENGGDTPYVDRALLDGNANGPLETKIVRH